MAWTAWRAALHEPTTYPEPTSMVEVQETHISLVFLTDHDVYKIKKPVNLGFLDFSTLAQRRFFCEQELTLNRRLSSEVYLEVVALHQDGRRYTFDGRGAVVEYALKMRRLPADCSLQALLQRGKDSEELMTTLAQRLATFHHAHPLPTTPDASGSLAHVQEDWTENFAQTTEHIGHTLSQHAYDGVRHAVETFMTQHAAWFAQRVEDGRIRDCHGDLRAEHIYYERERGQLQIIDCIEFNQRFRYIDVASDIAFLAMDLERLGAPYMAHRFVQAYIQASGDVSLYRLLDFYRCYRAYVRGKVTSMRLHNAPPEKRGPLQQQAESYFIMAARYAARCTQPLLILTAGIIASGKSTVAAGVAAALDVALYSSDRIRKAGVGEQPRASQRAAYGQGLYSETGKQRTYEALAALARQCLQQGRSVLLDASFAKGADRQRLVTIAEDMGARCCLLECLAPESVLRARLRAREQSPEAISDAREDILTQFQRDYEPIQENEFPCHVRMETTRHFEDCVQQALSAIQRT